MGAMTEREMVLQQIAEMQAQLAGQSAGNPGGLPYALALLELPFIRDCVFLRSYDAPYKHLLTQGTAHRERQYCHCCWW